MTNRPAFRLASLLLCATVFVAFAACSSAASPATEATPTLGIARTTASQPSASVPTALSSDAAPDASATSAPTEAPKQSPVVVATVTPVATASVLAPTQTPVSSASPVISFDPPQIRQGGFSVVYFNKPAVNATLTFGGNRYPMLQDGDRWWAIIGIGAFAEPGHAPVTVTYTPQGASGAVSINQSIEITDFDYPVENIDLDPLTSTLLDPAIVNNELAVRAKIYDSYTMLKLWSGPFVRPSDAAIGDVYGIARGYNGGPATDYHRGTDFTGQTGDPVVAAAAGRVVFEGPLQVRGNSIIIDHGAGVFTAYHHLSAFHVNQGDTVTAGQLIGNIGATGLVTGPHLHWEVIVRGVEVDGLLWLQGKEIGP
jgi:murein DD-endopeptidase MepM/ murein hydrolase activator NlpD